MNFKKNHALLACATLLSTSQAYAVSYIDQSILDTFSLNITDTLALVSVFLFGGVMATGGLGFGITVTKKALSKLGARL